MEGERHDGCLTDFREAVIGIWGLESVTWGSAPAL